jgi:RNA polymerase sigma-70 factor (ECF subfamily)
MIPTQWRDDAHLLKGAVDGDQKAAAALVGRLMPQAHALAWRMTGNAALAEDIVQEAFVRLWRMAGRWEPRAAVNTFFTRIVINLCYDHFRSNPNATVPLDEAALDETSDDSTDLLEALACRQSRGEIRDALQRLGARHRAVLIMWAYSDKDVREIALSMDMTENAVHQLLHRARGALRAQLSAPALRKGKIHAA